MISWHPAPLPYRGRLIQWLRERSCRRKGHAGYRYEARLGGVLVLRGYCLRCGYED